MTGILLGQEARKRKTPQEKIAIIQQTMEPGMSVSHVARLHGIQPSLLFKWKKQYQEGSLTAVAAGEQVVPASELAAALKQVRELQRLLGKKTMEVEILKEAVEYGQSPKMDSARALIAKGRGIAQVSRAMSVSRAQLSLRIKRSADWQDRRCHRRNDEADAEILSDILDIISDMPSYGYRRVWGILRKQRRTEGLPPVNAKRFYRIMSEHNLLLLHDKPERPKREHKGKIAVAESDMRWCSDGFEFGCDNGEKLRVMFALDCCDREVIDWAASTGGYDSSTVQDVMLRSVEKRFGDRLPDTPVQWLTDNGSAYTAHETRRFARELNLEPCTTAVSNPQSNGMAERFVKTMKEDYIAFMPKPDVRTALRNLAAAFTHYNENHPHSALGYHSPREYRRQRASLT
ncbi:IS3 family transposase [Salmonella enterica subsp. enterica serovar Muenchen]|uniref:IS3 family transposase n=1 Tax=Salmonella enterica TaxID=28901 RepID=UPI001D6FBD57|nr:IS3 family transposase [Salmonella enterica]EHM1640596.1 IS3 family transposase [Salmonella enterica subsp. enterica serovar Oranienburg]EHN2637498.1 IS3 family transposase [Salmonella enterica]EHO4597280.1 IS3 family transposase [Salmonella enterica]EHP2853108.1 IS3 family transposase [Salmonella enterica]EHX1052076.1 IS3 family transposase [Salmonella enterica subsp. enterica serovar Oranienburg]